MQIEPGAAYFHASIGERQRVEIVKALFHECRVLILDEPTAVLPPQDVRALFETVQRLRRTGLGVLFVSTFCARSPRSPTASSCSGGRLVGERVTAEVTTNELASLMMGGTAPEEDVASAVLRGRGSGGGAGRTPRRRGTAGAGPC